MQVIKTQLEEQGLIDYCEFCYNGEEALLKAVEIIKQSLLSNIKAPVCLMLLDQ
jgi:hypothetical protein